ncbi:hypothetical protein AB3662_37010 [Sorangium cellulosum]|uniref:hypothetical protein n=1 Tax=Sorangium cellulosum TaxID=56 RepID=UPI003D9A90BC
MTLRDLTIGDLKLALRDLLDERADELRVSATGKLYERRLRAKQKEIDAIPDAAGTQAPLARELSEADVRHDGLGAAIDRLLRRRATLLATGENAAATGPLRGAVVGLLGRFREALRDDSGRGQRAARGPRGAAVRLHRQAERRPRTRRARARGAGAGPDDGPRPARRPRPASASAGRTRRAR